MKKLLFVLFVICVCVLVQQAGRNALRQISFTESQSQAKAHQIAQQIPKLLGPQSKTVNPDMWAQFEPGALRTGPKFAPGGFPYGEAYCEVLLVPTYMGTRNVLLFATNDGVYVDVDRNGMLDGIFGSKREAIGFPKIDLNSECRYPTHADKEKYGKMYTKM